MFAFRKKDRGVCLIAVGCTLHRLVAKCASFSVREEVRELFAPTQLGYKVKREAKTAVNAAQHFLQNLQKDQVLVKLDFENAFNSLWRDKMLKDQVLVKLDFDNAFNSLWRNKMSRTVEKLAPSLLQFVYSAYSSPSSHFGGNTILASSAGVQQRDRLGALLFCLTIIT